MRSEYYTYILPDAQRRQENTRKLHAMHGAPIRTLDEIDEATLPYHDNDNTAREREPQLPTRQRRTYGRNILIALDRLRSHIAPTAELTIIRGGSAREDYLRLTEHDDAGDPVWALAEHEESGNALYIWRRDLSDTDLDTAFSTTRRAALGHGCLRRCHPANMDKLSAEETDRFYLEQVLEMLTA
jgi:hypothetical protein